MDGKIYGILILALLATATPSCEAPSGSGGSNIAMHNCGTSMTCMEQYFETCDPAKGTISDYGVTYYIEIQGGSDSACTTYVKFESSEYSGMGIATGADMTCVISTSEYFPMGDNPDHCTGTLKDMMVSSQGYGQ
ncbi:MAG: hypothetical protein V1911_03800 [Candidatus Micrarchaeota archaeon]